MVGACMTHTHESYMNAFGRLVSETFGLANFRLEPETTV